MVYGCLGLMSPPSELPPATDYCTAPLTCLWLSCPVCKERGKYNLPPKVVTMQWLKMSYSVCAHWALRIAKQHWRAHFLCTGLLQNWADLASWVSDFWVDPRRWSRASKIALVLFPQPETTVYFLSWVEKCSLTSLSHRAEFIPLLCLHLSYPHAGFSCNLFVIKALETLLRERKGGNGSQPGGQPWCFQQALSEWAHCLLLFLWKDHTLWSPFTVDRVKWSSFVFDNRCCVI